MNPIDIASFTNIIPQILGIAQFVAGALLLSGSVLAIRSSFRP